MRGCAGATAQSASEAFTPLPAVLHSSFNPGRGYFERNIDLVNSGWLDGFWPTPGFSREDRQKVIGAIRANAIYKLSERACPSSETLNRAVAAINFNTVRHSAQVMGAGAI